MRNILILILVGLFSSTSAEVYRWVDKDGVVHFGDQPGPGAETVTVPPMQTITPVPVQQLERRKAPETAVYSSLEVVKPGPDEAIRANSGAVTIQLALTPALRKNHQLLVNVDGVERPLPGLTMNLSNLPRGGHTVSAAIKDAKGKLLISSDTVNFFVLRVIKKRAP